MIASCGDRRIVASMRRHGHNPLQCAANADLIAKAPELLDAVENLLEAATWVLRSAGYEKGEALETLHELSVGRHHLDRLRTAVQKAKGHSYPYRWLDLLRVGLFTLCIIVMGITYGVWGNG